MKILLAPSEGKCQGGMQSTLDTTTLLFSALHHKRDEILKKYQDFLHSSNESERCKLFGVKDVKKLDNLQFDIFTTPTLKAIERYNGVAFEYLKYAQLDHNAQTFIDENTIIFSNLFGPILANNSIPEYKLKQGESIDTLKVEAYYKEHFSHAIDTYLQDEDILDLRAGFYDKFYKPTKAYTTLKFIKDGKVVSHWAKAYRGIVLREVAKNSINSLKAFENLEIEGIEFLESKTSKLKTERIYTIL